MSEERERILKMLADGKINVDEAEALLDAITNKTTTESSSAGNAAFSEIHDKLPTGKAPKFLRVNVDGKDGENVRVKVPLGLLRAGIKISSVMPSNISARVNSELNDQGFNIDLNSIKSEDIETLITHLSEMEINVDSKEGETVRIFCE